MMQMKIPLAPQTRARFYHGLAEPARLAILDALRGGERRAGDVAAQAGLSLSNASRHLSCLKGCGLVEARQEWREVYYRLADGVAELLAVQEPLIERIAARLASCDDPEMESRR
jgi:DNA-binding transcriptional ArsR family regulator